MTLNSSIATDPVCGMRLDTSATFITAQHNGRIYYFCSLGCQEGFQAEPQRYLALDYRPSAMGGIAGRVRGLFRGKDA